MKKPKTLKSRAIYSHHHSTGFTLVEILVAMVISLFLIGGVVQLFVQNKTSYKLQEGIARAQENGRLSLYFIEKHVRRAGYPWDGTDAFVGFKRTEAMDGAFINNDIIPIEGGSSSDALVVLYEAPPGGTSDCTGRNIASGKYIAMHFLIDGGGLKCESSTTDGSVATALSSAVLIPDVTGLQFTYGIDSNEDGIPDGVYVDADGIAADEWGEVIAVRAEVTVAVEPAALSDNATMVFTTTIPVRNHIVP